MEGRKPYGTIAQPAFQQANVTAWNVYTSLSNNNVTATPKREPLPFSYINLGEMLTLCKENTSITSLVRGVWMDGIPASVLMMLTYAVRMTAGIRC